jgi:hypothetical protein
MRIKKTVLALALILALLPASAALATEDPVGTAAMMGLGMGARALGMGGAHIAVADDASVIYYNPAGLALVDGISITSLYTNQYGAAGYLALGGAVNHIGAGILRLDASGIEKTDEFADEIGTIGVVDTAVMAGYGMTVMPNLSVGAAVKYYQQTLPENSGKGFTADLGVLYTMMDDKVRVGAVGRNLFGNVVYSSGAEDAFDRVFGLGVALEPMENLLVAADAVMDNGFSGKVGAEYRFRQMAFRAGGAFGGNGTCLTAGAGFQVATFNIDYAYQHHTTLPDSHRLSLGMKF